MKFQLVTPAQLKLLIRIHIYSDRNHYGRFSIGRFLEGGNTIKFCLGVQFCLFRGARVVYVLRMVLLRTWIVP